MPSCPPAREALDPIAALYRINDLFQHNRSTPADGASHVNGSYLTDTALNLPDRIRPIIAGDTVAFDI